MKVLEINSVCGTGSTGRIACQIADTVVQHGGEAIVSYGRSIYPEGCNVPTYRIGSNIESYIHAGLSRITDRQGFYSKRATKKFVKFIRKYNPDLIHLHNIHGYYLHIPTLFKFLSEFDRPVIWTLHDCWAFTGHCSYFDYVGCDKWKAGCYKCPQKKKYPKSILLDQSERNWKEKKQIFTSISNMTIVTPSHWLASLVQESFLNKYQVQVIHNGIDLELFKPTHSSWKEKHGITKPMILACASKWDQRKGLKDVLEIAEKLPEYQIVIVGLDRKQEREIPESILGISRTHDIHELVKIYSAADIFINPTYEDNFPTVNLEAIACGTPVITYDTGGSPECIFDANFGVVLSRGDLKLFVNTVSKVVRECLIKTDKNEILYNFYNKEIRYKEYLELFKRINR